MIDDRLGLPSASEIWRLDECSGSKILIESLRDKGIDLSFSNVYASLGERIHASLEGYPEDLDRRAQQIRDDCDRLAKNALAEFMPDPIYETLYEERLWYTLSDIPFFSGKPDRVGVHPLRILDVNFKTGRGDEEDAPLNLQLRCEEVLLHHRYSDVPEIGVTIVQPLVSFTPEIAVYNRKAMDQAEAEILEIVDRAAWNPKRTAGVHCKHCPARAYCPEAREMTNSFPVRVAFEKLPSGFPATEMMNRLNVAYEVLDALWDAFQKKIQADPKSVPGWHIHAGNKVRFLDKKKELAFSAYAQEQGMSIQEAMKFSVTAFEDIASKKWNLKGKTFEKKFAAEFGEFFDVREDPAYLKKKTKKQLQLEDQENEHKSV